jgi:hypothetical protein
VAETPPANHDLFELYLRAAFNVLFNKTSRPRLENWLQVIYGNGLVQLSSLRISRVRRFEARCTRSSRCRPGRARETRSSGFLPRPLSAPRVTGLIRQPISGPPCQKVRGRVMRVAPGCGIEGVGDDVELCVTPDQAASWGNCGGAGGWSITGYTQEDRCAFKEIDPISGKLREEDAFAPALRPTTCEPADRVRG